MIEGPTRRQQPCFHLAGEADEQRCKQQHQRHLGTLNQESDDHGHIAAKSRTTRTTKTRLEIAPIVRNWS